MGFAFGIGEVQLAAVDAVVEGLGVRLGRAAGNLAVQRMPADGEGAGEGLRLRVTIDGICAERSVVVKREGFRHVKLAAACARPRSDQLSRDAVGRNGQRCGGCFRWGLRGRVGRAACAAEYRNEKK